MGFRNVIFCTLCTSLPLLSMAYRGESMDMAKQRFGSPVGMVKSGGRTILIFQSPWGKITETYDAKGICIESDADQIAPRPAPARIEPDPPAEPVEAAPVSVAEEPDIIAELPEVAFHGALSTLDPSLPKGDSTAAASSGQPMVDANASDGSDERPTKPIPSPEALILAALFVLSLIAMFVAFINRIEAEESCRPGTEDESGKLNEYMDNPNRTGTSHSKVPSPPQDADAPLSTDFFQD